MFENATMLAGIGGAVIPLVIHFLSRARFRTVGWGAMMFLDSGRPVLRDGGKLREGALLGVRMSAVGLLAVALARPTLAPVAPASGTTTEARSSSAIVIDCSASMARAEVGATRLDAAKQAAVEILSTLQRGDRVSLIPVGAGPLPSAPVFSGDLQSVAARVNDLKPGRGLADMPAAIELAEGALAKQDRSARQLYVICDHQAASWRGASEAGAPVSGLARFAVIPVGGRETDNLAIESVAVLDLPAVAGAPAQIEVRLRNYGSEARGGVPLSLRIGGREVFVTTLNVPAGGTTTADATVMFPAVGSSVLTARIRDAAPGLDDSLDEVVDVQPSLRVLVIGGGSSGDALEAALAPYHSAGRPGADLAAVTRLALDQWNAATDLSKYHLIILDDVPGVPDQRDASGNSALKSLEQFVYAGGGLLIAPGESARTEDYNRALYREEGGLLPALLQPAVSPSSPTSIEVATLDTTHPALRFLAGRSAPLPVLVDRYFPTTGRTPSAHVLGGFATGDPFLIDSPYGRGHVLLVTCSLRARWTTLPLTSLYLPLMQSSARYLASSGVEDRNLSLGEELVATFDPPVDPPRVSVRRPDGSPVEVVDAPNIEGRSEARYARTDAPGIYRVWAGRGKGRRTELFSVAAPLAESDPTPLTASRWHGLAKAYGFSLMEPDGRPLAAQLAPRVIVGNEWIILLGVVLGLLVLEMGLARRWSMPRTTGGGEAT